jgi:hypothetical protein
MIDFRQMTLILFFITIILTFALLYHIIAKIKSKIMRCLLLCVSTILVSSGTTILLSNAISVAIPITTVKVMRYDDKDINKLIYDVNELYENKDIPNGVVLLTIKEWKFIKNVTAEIHSLGE